MKTKIYILLIVIILLSLFLNISTFAYNENRINRIVSIVYDDSGSMNDDDRWIHANYALQTLVGMLGTGDIVILEYMNQKHLNARWIINDDNVDDIISYVRRNSYPDLHGRTPLNSVEQGAENTATHNIPELNSNNEYEYWFVLITDGDEMYVGENKIVNYTEDSYGGYLDEEIIRILNTLDSNCKSVVLKIGNQEKDFHIDENSVGCDFYYKSAAVYDNSNSNEIIDRMNEIASLISGRMLIDYETNNKNQISFETGISCDEILIILQNSNSEIKEVKVNNKIDNDVIISSQQLSGPNGSSSLAGEIIHITLPSDEYLKPSQYTFEFDKEISDARIKVLFSPAIDFEFNYLYNGEATREVFNQDEIQIQVLPIDRATGQVTEYLNDEMVYNLFINEHSEILFEDTNLSEKFIINPSFQSFSFSATVSDKWKKSVYQDFDLIINDMTRDEYQAYLDSIPREVTLDIQPDGINTTYNTIDFAPGITITPQYNNANLTDEEFDLASLEIVEVLPLTEQKYSDLIYGLRENSNTWVFRIRRHIFKPFTATGDYSITVRFESNDKPQEYAEETFIVTIEDIPWLMKWIYLIIGLIILILLAVYIIRIITKKRFANSLYVNYEYYRCIGRRKKHEIDSESKRMRSSFFKRWFVPSKREKMTYQGLIFYASDSKNQIILAEDSLSDDLFIGKIRSTKAMETIDDSGSNSRFRGRILAITSKLEKSEKIGGVNRVEEFTFKTE